MNTPLPAYLIGDPIRVENTWVFPDGKTLPVISGGSEDDGGAPPPAPPAPPTDPSNVPLPPSGAIDPSTGQPGRTFTPEEVERFRSQEREKVYKTIEEQKERIKALEEIEAQRDAERRAAEQAEAEARRKAEEAEMEAKQLLERKDQEWSQRFEMLQSRVTEQEARLEAEREMARKEREFAELMIYRQNRLQENADQIIPELAELVSGETREEIEQSISSMIERSRAIIGNVTSAAQATGPLGQRGPSVTAPPVGPMENEAGSQTLTAEDIRNMSMADYAKHRDKILPSAGQMAQQQGPYAPQ